MKKTLEFEMQDIELSQFGDVKKHLNNFIGKEIRYIGESGKLEKNKVYQLEKVIDDILFRKIKVKGQEEVFDSKDFVLKEKEKEKKSEIKRKKEIIEKVDTTKKQNLSTFKLKEKKEPKEKKWTQEEIDKIRNMHLKSALEGRKPNQVLTLPKVESVKEGGRVVFLDEGAEKEERKKLLNIGVTFGDILTIEKKIKKEDATFITFKEIPGKYNAKMFGEMISGIEYKKEVQNKGIYELVLEHLNQYNKAYFLKEHVKFIGNEEKEMYDIKGKKVDFEKDFIIRNIELTKEKDIYLELEGVEGYFDARFFKIKKRLKNA